MGKPCRSPSRLGAHMVVSSDLLSRVALGGRSGWAVGDSHHHAIGSKSRTIKPQLDPRNVTSRTSLLGELSLSLSMIPFATEKLAEITVTDTTAEGWWDENGLMVLQHLIIDSLRKMHRDRDLRRPAKARYRIKALLAPVSGISPASQSLEPCESARCNLMIDN
ncbi:hypothetical protein NA56DRAFT_654957 [Hyaloscypha hepaticicola]|uniref:Uncharacterized protein n=1 Tax=Hyaloscypha hepaticicola TaxID=2082293 RepID=A0A2J6QJA9_9HELO|nr:hypothetical protein NA56DRAFT_654957 [Hyaloscypha hepaticicola]